MDQEIQMQLNKMTEVLGTLETTINERIEKLKNAMADFLTLGSDFARASLITSLKQI